MSLERTAFDMYSELELWKRSPQKISFSGLQASVKHECEWRMGRVGVRPPLFIIRPYSFRDAFGMSIFIDMVDFLGSILY